jgi:hypothetical protein
MKHGDDPMEKEINQAVLDFYAELGFEETQIEEGLMALCIEISPEENYGLLTNDNGNVPETLREPVIFACYTQAGSFLWSTSFKNSYLVQETWIQEQELSKKFEAVKDYRKNNENPIL